MEEADGGCVGKPHKITISRQVDDLTGNDETSDTPTTSIRRQHSKRYYKMTNKLRGRALIFNHYKFSSALNLKNREGTDIDCGILIETLIALDFKVNKFQDLHFKRIKKKVKNVSKENYSNKDCVIVAILSHGSDNTVWAYDIHYDPQILWKMFDGRKNSTFKGKPVMFFINACQGDKLHDGIPYQVMEKTTLPINNMQNDEHDTNPTDIKPNNHAEFQMPNQRDLLVNYSTAPGYKSWRKPETGSWFIQELCCKLNKNKYTKDILTILTSVVQAVAINYESFTEGSDNRIKQVPSLFSQLTKRFQFVERKSNK